MPRYSAVWLEIAREQHDSYPSDIRGRIDATIERPLENPHVYGSYDKRTDQWTTTFGAGAGAGLIVYAIVRSHFKVIILRLV